MKVIYSWFIIETMFLGCNNKPNTDNFIKRRIQKVKEVFFPEGKKQ
jgi:hypothetical protein